MNIATTEDLHSLKRELLTEINRLLSSQPKPLPTVLRGSQVKKLLNCSDSKLETLRKTGQLPFVKILGTIYYQLDHINQLINQTGPFTNEKNQSNQRFR